MSPAEFAKAQITALEVTLKNLRANLDAEAVDWAYASTLASQAANEASSLSTTIQVAHSEATAGRFEITHVEPIPGRQTGAR
jgi:hypothetical protein